MEHLLTNSSIVTQGTTSGIDRLLDKTSSSLVVTNSICCGIVVAYKIIQYLVFGRLRVSEQQNLRETFWNYFTQKGIFVFFILDAYSYEERSPWVVWYTLLGSVLLLSRLCKDRFEYLSSLPEYDNWTSLKIKILITILMLLTLVSNVMIFLVPITTNSLFQLGGSSYCLVYVLHIITKYILLNQGSRNSAMSEKRSSIFYYSDLFFTMSMFIIDLLHHFQLLIVGNTVLLVKCWCLIRIHTLAMEMRRDYKQHKDFLSIVNILNLNFSMASKNEIEKNSDDCAICWDKMESARKLPCGHLFHNSCLVFWLVQDKSCPTCRLSLKWQPDDYTVNEDDDLSESDEEFIETARTHQRNHIFHFDSSRYTNNPFLSWLPTISIEGFM